MVWTGGWENNKSRRPLFLSCQLHVVVNVWAQLNQQRIIFTAFRFEVLFTPTKCSFPLCADRSLLSHSVTWWSSMRATSAQWPSSLSKKRRIIRSSHQPTLQVVDLALRTVSTASLVNDRVPCLLFFLRCNMKYVPAVFSSRAGQPDPS